jgi:hypothetical protein
MRDIYDPPPAPVAFEAPGSEPLRMRRGDLVCLVFFIMLLSIAAGWAWAFEPTVALMIMLGGGLVIFESWFTALGFLHLQPSESLTGRWVIFLAALLPWIVGLGIAASLIWSFFFLADRLA